MLELTREQLMSALSYDPETGVFTRVKPRTRVFQHRVGTVQSQGYLQINVCGKRYLAHRLAWLWVYGEMPTLFIDHINGEKLDNRIANLRPATNRQNQQNRRRTQANNTCGFTGVSRTKNSRYVASITDAGRDYRLGSYETAQEAYEAYLRAKARLHEFSRAAAQYRAPANEGDHNAVA